MIFVLLISWLHLGKLSVPDCPWDLVEFFCGKGRISTLATQAGFAVASCDIELGHPSKKQQARRRKIKDNMFPKRPPCDMNGGGWFGVARFLIFKMWDVSMCFRILWGLYF